MKIDILTLFPAMFAPLAESIVKKAQEKGLVKINIHNLRDWADDKHNTVDSPPFGGEAGMVLRVDVIDKAVKDLERSSKSSVAKSKSVNRKPKVVLLSPQGKKYTQSIAKKYSKLESMILISGHYEGFDERIREHLVDEEISVGDYVLTGGEIPAMVVVDSVVRLLPGVLGDKESLVGETHSKKGHKKHPVYTKPREYKGWKVPEVLTSGDHKKIKEWKKLRKKENL